MPKYIGIDPGPFVTGVVFIEYENGIVKIIDKANLENETLEGIDAVQWLRTILGVNPGAEVAIEFVQSFGTAGESLYQTAAWAGEFRRIAKDMGSLAFFHYRKHIAAHIAGVNSKDAAVRRALIERIGGTKKGEPMHGVTSHMISALATALYHAEGAVLGEWTQEAMTRKAQEAAEKKAAALAKKKAKIAKEQVQGTAA